jgi:hypothetical protein
MHASVLSFPYMDSDRVTWMDWDHRSSPFLEFLAALIHQILASPVALEPDALQYPGVSTVRSSARLERVSHDRERLRMRSQECDSSLALQELVVEVAKRERVEG